MSPTLFLHTLADFILSASPEGLAERLAAHYRKWRLMLPDGSWASPLLARLGPELLPAAVPPDDVRVFLRNALDLLLRNPLFADFLEQALSRRFPQLETAAQAEGRRVLPDVLALALALDRLTRACRRNFRVWAECRRLLNRALRQSRAWRKTSLFLRAKAASVDPVAFFCIRAHDRPPQALGPDSGSRWLQVNILEAVLVDLCEGFRDNARAGWILARHKPGRRTPDPATGAGPNTWSADAQAICLHPPLPQAWADLYQLWNMAFVSQLPESPYALAKLLVPAVAHYADAPEAYMYSRVIALHLFLAWMAMDRAESPDARLRHLPWNDPGLTRLWGACARAAALRYRDLVRCASASPLPPGSCPCGGPPAPG